MSFIESGLINKFAFIDSPVREPVNRFCYMGPEEVDGIILMAFSIPSRSRKGSRVYKLLLDPFTMETSCGCEFKQIHKGKVNVTKLQEPVCWHLRSLSHWIRRKANKQKLDDMRIALEFYYDQQRRSA